MGRVLLVRHGQASFGADDYDALSDLGFTQSRLLGASFRERGIVADAVLGGGMRRHRETAETCAEAAGWAVSLEVDDGWDEFDFLAVLGAQPAPAPEPGVDDRAAFQRWFEVATEQWIAGADLPYPETFAAFNGRVEAALDRAAARTGTTVVFTSGGPMAWAVASLLGDGTTRAALWTRLNRVAVNTGTTRLITGARGTNLVSYNEQAHLDGVPDALSYR